MGLGMQKINRYVIEIRLKNQVQDSMCERILRKQ